MPSVYKDLLNQVDEKTVKEFMGYRPDQNRCGNCQFFELQRSTKSFATVCKLPRRINLPDMRVESNGICNNWEPEKKGE